MGFWTTIVEFLQTGGPYALLAIVGVAYYKKDQHVEALNKQLLEAYMSQSTATMTMNSSINGLKDTMQALSNLLSHR